MKKPLIVSTAMAVAILIYLSLYTTKKEASGSEKEIELTEREGEEELQSGAGRQASMLFQARAYPDPYYLNDKYLRAWEQAQKLREETYRRSSRIQSLSNWATLGPVSTIGGRVLCLTIDPNNSNNLWAGSASGGIWKSTNAGTSWTSVTTGLPVLGVSSILVDPSNSNVIYAGTGEVTRMDTSNIGFNIWKGRGTYGIGIIKSTNGGTTWSQVMTKSTSQLFAIQAMRFDPTNSNTIYACATDGLYRSLDNGSTWSLILSKIYVKDICINPSNTDQIVVSIGNMVNSDKGIYRTTNGNNASPTWTKITSGLPSAFEGYIRLDNVGSGEMMASIGISSSTASSNREIYRSTDFGLNWSVVGGTTAGTTTNHCSYQFWFAHTVAINPFATDSIMFAGVNWYRYRVSTTTRTSVTVGHADVHDIVYDPVYRGRIYLCCDGGIYRSTNGGSSFSRINTGLDAVQFYASLGVSTTNPDYIVGGLQDNGQVIYNGSSWSSISWSGGDGTACAIDPNDDQNFLVSRDARQVYRSTNGGSTGGSVTSYWGFVADSRTGFVAPLAYSKSNSTIIYLASDNLHKSTNSGASFSNDAYGSATNYIEALHKTAIALAVSSTNSNKVYVSTSPFAQYDNDDNRIYVTGQPNLLKTTTGNTPFTSIKGTLPDRFVTDIAISPTNDDSVYITLGGFGTSHIYVTSNGGTSWSALGGSLPDVPFNAVVFDPVNPTTIYAGSDMGVYVSSDRGLNWIDYNTGFPESRLVMDLQITADNKLVAATHGRGIYKSDLFTGSTILPVSILDFAGVHHDNYNELKWKVAQETNLSHYELEKSTDGVNYLKVANINDRNSQAEVSYSYNDYSGNGLPQAYYRLKMINDDRTHKYSPVILLRQVTKTTFKVTNPVQDYVILQYTMPADEKIIMQVFNATGTLLKKQEYAATAGTGAYTLYGFRSYPPGIYYLKVWVGKKQETFKLMKE